MVWLGNHKSEEGYLWNLDVYITIVWVALTIYIWPYSNQMYKVFMGVLSCVDDHQLIACVFGLLSTG
jgi:hypothetical protein